MHLAQFGRSKYCFLVLVLLICFFSISHTHDSTDVSSSVLVQEQLKSIAHEVVSKVKLDPGHPVAFQVEGDGPRILVENAFIEILQEKNYSTRLRSHSSDYQTLSVYILGITVSAKQLDSQLFERSCRTSLEARMESGTDHQVQFLGSFKRESLDTVHTYPSFSFYSQQQDSEDSLTQRIFTPFILIGGAILVVYLFFTVRS